MATELIRRPIKTQGLKSLTTEVMQEVKEVLGYDVLMEEVDVIRRVAEIFKKLEIEPLETKRVELYKKEMAASVTSKSKNYSWNGDGRRYYRTVKGVWRQKTLRGYTKAIPPFALLRANEIQKATQAAGIEGAFFVEELTRKHSTVIIDPFMVFVVAGKKFYTDVWDEPKFEGRRTV
jgi:hypothetical protein